MNTPGTSPSKAPSSNSTVDTVANHKVEADAGTFEPNVIHPGTDQAALADQFIVGRVGLNEQDRFRRPDPPRRRRSYRQNAPAVVVNYRPERRKTLADCDPFSPVSIFSFIAGLIAFGFTACLAFVNLAGIFQVTVAAVTYSAPFISFLVAGTAVFVGVWLAILAASWAYIRSREVTGAFLISTGFWIAGALDDLN